MIYIRTTDRQFPSLYEIVQLFADFRKYAARRRQERIDPGLSAAVF